jgi:hypothetical protein
VGVGIILTDIVPVTGHRFVGSYFFQPDIIIMMQAGFIVIDENRRGYMHGVAQNQALFDAALPQTFFNFRGYVDKGAPGGDLKPQFFAVAFHFFAPFLVLWDTDDHG